MTGQRWYSVRGWWCVGFSLVFATTVAAQSPPVISRIEPLGIAPGATVSLTAYGSELSAARKLVTSAGGPFALSAGTDSKDRPADRAVFDCTLPSDASQGLHTLRIAGDGGVSTQRLWLVDDLPAQAQGDDNLTSATAQVIPIPAAVDGRIGNLQRRFFRFEAEAGQRIGVEVYARRLGSALDPLVVLCRADGRQVAGADDTPGLGGDCQLNYEAEAAGSYTLELRDIRYRGGDDYAFRLRIGDFPCVQTTYPLAIARGVATPVEFAGLDVDGVDAVTITPAADRSDDWQPVIARRRGGRAASYSTVLLSDRPEVLEAEPNDTRNAAQPSAPDHNLNGRFHASGDVDCYRYSVEKGARLVFEGEARSEGSPADLQLRLLDADGKQVAAADDDGANEGRLDHTFAAAGVFTLEVSDLTRRGGASFVYRIVVQPFAAGFRLALGGDAVNVPQGGTAVLSVQATRLGYSGEIDLEVEGLPEGIQAAPAVIGTGLTAGHISLSTGDATTFDVSAIRVVGAAKIGTQSIRETADVAGWLREHWNHMAVVPPAARRSLAAHSASVPQLALTVDPAAAVFGPNLSAEMTVIVRRGSGLEGDVVLSTIPEKDALPKEVSLELKPIPAGQERVTLKFTGSEKAPLGRFSLALLGTLKKDKETVTATTPVVSYRLAAPWTLTLDAGSAPLRAGGSQPLTVRIDRNPAFQGAVRIQAAGLPAGVSLAEGTMAADTQSIELTLTAAADSAVGPVTGAKLLVAAVDNAKLKSEWPLTGIKVAAPE